MRIAYIAPYQGPRVLRARPIVVNLSLAGNLKIELIAKLLQQSGHQVEILSQGEIVGNHCRFYRSFNEPVASHPEITAYYASVFPLKYVNAAWPSLFTLSLFRKRHRLAPYDLVLLYNLKGPQLACALYAIRRLGVPVVLEYEDDAIVDVNGKSETGIVARIYFRLVNMCLRLVSGCTGVSPHLLSQVPSPVPKLLLRGVVSDDVLAVGRDPHVVKKNWVVYSGTHSQAKGLAQLVSAWRMLDLPDWELHIAGHGGLTPVLKTMAEQRKDIVFRGLLNQRENAALLASAKIAINPHDVSDTPGNVFAFKIIEYLAAGAHVISTPMGFLEPELETGITYMPENTPATIARTIMRVVAERLHEQNATQAAQNRYGPAAIATSLDRLVRDASIARVEQTKLPIKARESNA